MGITSACAPGIKPTPLVCLEAVISYLPIYWYLNNIIADLGNFEKHPSTILGALMLNSLANTKLKCHKHVTTKQDYF